MADEMKNQELDDEGLGQVSGGYYDMKGKMNPYFCKCSDARPGLRCGSCAHIMRWFWEGNPNHEVWDCKLGRKPFRA